MNRVCAKELDPEASDCSIAARVPLREEPEDEEDEEEEEADDEEVDDDEGYSE
jgi:hypothetical protein